MRRLHSKKDEAKRTKKNQMIIGVILIIVMFGSVFGVIVGSFNNSSNESRNVNYYGTEFISQGGYWYTTIGSLQFVFRHNPFETEYMYNKSVANLTYLNGYQNLPLYVSSENSGAEIEIYRNLGQVTQRIQRACLEGDENSTSCVEDLPIKNCNNNFIIIRESLNNESEIIQEGRCVFITANKQNLLKLTDDYLYRIIGVR